MRMQILYNDEASAGLYEMTSHAEKKDKKKNARSKKKSGTGWHNICKTSLPLMTNKEIINKRKKKGEGEIRKS